MMFRTKELGNTTSLVSLFFIALLTLTILPAISIATIIEADLTALGGDHYRYDYTVTNDTLGAPLELFDLLFDPTLYDETTLTIVSDPAIGAGWVETILMSAPGFGAAYDLTALGGGIAPGALLSGFAIEFDWLGGGAPGVQPFEVYDPNTYVLLDSGTTILNDSSGTVPVPATLSLITLGLVGIGSSMAAPKQIAKIRNSAALAKRRLSPAREGIKGLCKNLKI